MWQKVEPSRQHSGGVKISPQKVNGAIHSVSLLIPPEAWEGEPPEKFDLFVDAETQSLRAQEGSSYAGHTPNRQRGFRISCWQALKILGIPVPPATIAPPFKWHDGGLEIDLSQWGRKTPCVNTTG